jgi:hypothetical protein
MKRNGTKKRFCAITFGQAFRRYIMHFAKIQLPCDAGR